MKKFSFSLQKILDLRNFELDQAQMELGKVNAQIANVNNQLKTVAIHKFNATRDADAANDFSLHVDSGQVAQSISIASPKEKKRYRRRTASR